jgi:type II secretory pathway pseudopilin PulG
VEIVIVLALIAVLVAILMPVLASVREKARQSTCISNLRQLGLATQMYMSDNDGQRPPRFESLILSGLIKEKGICVCPNDRAGNWGGLVYEGQRSITLPPETTQYSYVNAFNMPDWEWKALTNWGPSAGIMACQVHGQGEPAKSPFVPSSIDYEGLILRLQLDGAVVPRQTRWQHVMTESGSHVAYGNYWFLFCDDLAARKP